MISLLSLTVKKGDCIIWSEVESRFGLERGAAVINAVVTEAKESGDETRSLVHSKKNNEEKEDGLET